MGRSVSLSGKIVRFVFLPVWLVFAIVFGLIGWMSRRREEEEEDTEDIVLVAPEDESEDERRRSLQDQSPTERCEQVDRWHHQTAAQVVPQVPMEVWARDRKAANECRS